jgi:hypothetical protein
VAYYRNGLPGRTCQPEQGHVIVESLIAAGINAIRLVINTRLWGSLKPSEGAKYQSGSPAIIVLKAMQNRQPDNLLSRLFGRRGQCKWFGNALVYYLMRTAVIEEGDILLYHPPSKSFAEDQDVIHAFAPNTANEALTHRVGSWSLERRVGQFDVNACDSALKLQS